MNNAYVYQHVRLDTNEVFYVGIGTKCKGPNDYQRAHRITRRSVFWNKVFAKAGRAVEIVMDNIDVHQAKQKEIELIFFHGKRTTGAGPLVNLTDGGDGLFGYQMTDDHKKKIGAKNKNRKRTPEEIEQNRITHIGRKHSPESLEKMRIISTGKRHSQATKNMIRAQRIGVKRSPETIEKMRIGLTGKKHSPESCAKKCKLVLNMETGVFYESASEAAKSINLSISKLSNRLKGWANNNTSMAYV